jgi:hypothetical protein
VKVQVFVEKGVPQYTGVGVTKKTVEKGLALVPKKTGVDWGVARKLSVALLPQ